MTKTSDTIAYVAVYATLIVALLLATSDSSRPYLLTFYLYTVMAICVVWIGSWKNWSKIIGDYLPAVIVGQVAWWLAGYLLMSKLKIGDSDIYVIRCITGGWVVLGILPPIVWQTLGNIRKPKMRSKRENKPKPEV